MRLAAAFACRLRQLDVLKISSVDTAAHAALAMTMLYSMRMQLPRLRTLTVIVEDTEDWLRAEDALRELGRITQLNRLCLKLDATEVSSPGCIAHHVCIRQHNSTDSIIHFCHKCRSSSSS